MVHQLTQWATSVPAPIFILLLTVLVFGSTGGIPIPVTLAIFLSGALAIHMPFALLVFTGLLIGITIGSAARDLLAFVVIRWAGRFAHRQVKQPNARKSEPQNTWLHRIWQWGEHHYQTPEIQRAHHLMEHRQWILLCFSRLTPITPVFNIGAVLVNSSVVSFLWGVIPGRLLFTVLWLGAGASFGNAWSKGASFMQLISIASVVVVILLILPAFIGHRLLQSGPQAETSTVALDSPIVRRTNGRVTDRRTRPSTKMPVGVSSAVRRSEQTSSISFDPSLSDKMVQ